MFDEIKELVANNDHTRAYIEGCKFLGLDDLAEELERIEYGIDHNYKLYDFYNAARHEAYKLMISEAKKQMGKDSELFADFHGSF